MQSSGRAHDSPVGTIEPTGRTLLTHPVLITRYENEKAAETRLCFDQVAVLTQLGAMPTQVAVPV